MSRSWWWAAGLAGLLLGASNGQPAAAQRAGVERKLTSGGLERSWVQHVPESVAKAGKAAPAVLLLHGAKGNADSLQAYLGMNDVADRDGFIVVYPQGVDGNWADGRPDSLRWSRAPKVNDVVFLNTLVEELVKSGLADPNQVFIGGLANGGYMTFRMACESPDRFAAFAPILASAPLSVRQTCRAGQGLPILMINGTNDWLTKWGGQRAHAKDNRGIFAVPDLADFLGKLNGCTGVEEERLPSRDANSWPKVVHKTWTGCKGRGAIEHYIVEGGGHQAPTTDRSRGQALLTIMLGRRNHDFDTAEAMWAFFRKHGR